ncbi:UNVERIFIED_CONTAM: hypothetical protein K2H54_054713 [Gekko kuhli]
MVLLDLVEVASVVRGKDVSTVKEAVADVGCRVLLESVLVGWTVEELCSVTSVSVVLEKVWVALPVGYWLEAVTAPEVSEDASSVLEKRLVRGVLAGFVLSDGTTEEEDGEGGLFGALVIGPLVANVRWLLPVASVPRPELLSGDVAGLSVSKGFVARVVAAGGLSQVLVVSVQLVAGGDKLLWARVLGPWKDSIAAEGMMPFWVLLIGPAESGPVAAGSEATGGRMVLLDSVKVASILRGKVVSAVREGVETGGRFLWLDSVEIVSPLRVKVFTSVKGVAEVARTGLLDSVSAVWVVEKPCSVTSASVALEKVRVALPVGDWLEAVTAPEDSEDISSVLKKRVVWGVLAGFVISDGTMEVEDGEGGLFGDLVLGPLVPKVPWLLSVASVPRVARVLGPWEDSVAAEGMMPFWVLLKGPGERGPVAAGSEVTGGRMVLLDSVEVASVLRGKVVSAVRGGVADVRRRVLLSSVLVGWAVEEPCSVTSVSVALEKVRVALPVGDLFEAVTAPEVSEDTSSVLEKRVMWGVLAAFVISDGTSEVEDGEGGLFGDLVLGPLVPKVPWLLTVASIPRVERPDSVKVTSVLRGKVVCPVTEGVADVGRRGLLDFMSTGWAVE